MVKNNIVIENARIGFRNFSGKEGKFNPKGRRNFCVFLEPSLGVALEADGWNVRWLNPRDEDEERQPYLQVAVSYDNIPPKIVLMSSRGKTILDGTSVLEDGSDASINILDWAEIKEIDLIVRPYNWDVNGKTGVKAYVKAMYVTIAEDEFEAKYTNVPDSASDTIGGCGNCEECDGSCTSHGD